MPNRPTFESRDYGVRTVPDDAELLSVEDDTESQVWTFVDHDEPDLPVLFVQQGYDVVIIDAEELTKLIAFATARGILPVDGMLVVTNAQDCPDCQHPLHQGRCTVVSYRPAGIYPGKNPGVQCHCEHQPSLTEIAKLPLDQREPFLATMETEDWPGLVDLEAAITAYIDVMRSVVSICSGCVMSGGMGCYTQGHRQIKQLLREYDEKAAAR